MQASYRYHEMPRSVSSLQTVNGAHVKQRRRRRVVEGQKGGEEKRLPNSEVRLQEPYIYPEH